MTLHLENVHYRYISRHQTVHAVRGVSYDFQEGLVYAIMGKSGCGKSTLLSLIGGLLLPTEGAVSYDGVATAALDCNQLRRDQVSLIYQNYNLFPWLTAEENAAYPLLIRGQRKKEALPLACDCLKAVEIQPSQYKRLPSSLSGGEQQRVAISRALASGSPIILADEPTGNLDTANSQNVIKILMDLAHKEKRCVVIATHDPSIGAIADVSLRMQDGVFLP